MSSSLCINGLPPKSAKDFTEILVNMNLYEEILGVVLILGCIGAVIPQHLAILKNKSTKGISYLWIFFSQINQFSSFINALLLKFPQVRACAVLGLVKCSPSLLTLYQLFGIWLVNFPLYWWVLMFSQKHGSTDVVRQWKIARATFYVFLGYAAATLVTAFALLSQYGECHGAVLYFGYCMGLLSTVLTVLQWTPQIYQTWKQKSGGSLSILMLCIQAPGSLIIVYFLIFLSKESVTTWAAYFISAVEQFVLLGMIITFAVKSKLSSKKKGENEPLLP